MQTKQSIITLVGAAILLLFALAVISFVPPAPTIHALSPSLQEDPQRHVGFDTLDDFVEAGEYMHAGLLFASFPCIDNNDDDKCTHEDDFTTVTYRFDILHRWFRRSRRRQLRRARVGLCPQFFLFIL